MLVPPERGNDWLGISREPLPVEAGLAWAQVPSCGGTVCFTGTVRDHAEGRTGVKWLEYEAYTEQVEPRMQAIAGEARSRWPEIGRVVLLHRVGRLQLSEVAVVAIVSAPHRDEAFAGARFAIDTLKHTAPIWKKECWDEGEDWGTCAHPVSALARQDGAGGVGVPAVARPRPEGRTGDIPGPVSSSIGLATWANAPRPSSGPRSMGLGPHAGSGQ